MPASESKASRRPELVERLSLGVLESAPDAVVVVDEQGDIILANARTAAMFGYEPGELVGQSVDLLVPDRMRLQHQGHRADFAAKACPRPMDAASELVGRRRDGSEFPVEISLSPIPCPEGPVVVAAVRDVTDRKETERRLREDLAERKRIERALRASEERYRVVAETATDAIITIDGQSRIVYANPATEQMFGYALSNLIGRSLTTLMPNSARPRHVAAVAKFVATGRPSLPWKGLRLNGLHRSGRDVPLEVSFGFLRQQEGTTFFTGILRDISERIQTETELEKKRQELAHVMRVTTMGEMAAGLAHEVNQPLAAIAAYAQGASVRIRAGKAKLVELGEAVARIAEDAHRAGEIVRRLRQFVQKRPTERSAVDPDQIVREICRFVVSEAAHRQVTVEMKLAAGLPKVEADSIEIQQVLLNLVCNAFDAVAPMEARNRRVCVRTRLSPAGEAEMIVDDSGPGISANLQAQVFEPFFTSKDAGLGMGLAICRTLVESHGGRIWIRKSRLGGASVRFSLPLAKEDAAHGD